MRRIPTDAEIAVLEALVAEEAGLGPKIEALISEWEALESEIAALESE